MKNTSKSVRNVIVGKSNAKENIALDPNAVLEIVRDFIKAIEIVKIDSLTEAMCDADATESDIIADILRRAYPDSVATWYEMDDATIADLDDLINDPPKPDLPTPDPKPAKKSSAKKADPKPAKKSPAKKADPKPAKKSPAKKTPAKKKVATPPTDEDGSYE